MITRIFYLFPRIVALMSDEMKIWHKPLHNAFFNRQLRSLSLTYLLPHAESKGLRTCGGCRFAAMLTDCFCKLIYLDLCINVSLKRRFFGPRGSCRFATRKWMRDVWLILSHTDSRSQVCVKTSLEGVICTWYQFITSAVSKWWGVISQIWFWFFLLFLIHYCETDIKDCYID